eukprot:760584-Amphidinium_carterae.1
MAALRRSHLHHEATMIEQNLLPQQRKRSRPQTQPPPPRTVPIGAHPKDYVVERRESSHAASSGTQQRTAPSSWPSASSSHTPSLSLCPPPAHQRPDTSTPRLHEHSQGRLPDSRPSVPAPSTRHPAYSS